jgi:hypothetical protein
VTVDDRLGAGDVLIRMLHAIDRLDWKEVRSCLDEEVHTDYTELNGGEPQRTTADELIAQWQGLLPGFDATQHLTGPVLVEDDATDAGRRVEAHVRGYHHLAGAEGGEVWAVHGNYVARIRPTPPRWVVSSLTLEVFYHEGNPALPACAQERAADRPRMPRPRTP